VNRTPHRGGNTGLEYIDFEEQALDLYRNGDIDEFRVHPPCIVTRSDDNKQYLRQFLPHIKEDLRCELKDKLAAISDKDPRVPCESVCCSVEYLEQDEESDTVYVTFTLREADRSKVGGDFVKVVIAIKVPEGRGDAVVLGIASLDHGGAEEDEDGAGGEAGEPQEGPRPATFTVKLMRNACDQLNRVERLTWYELCPLIPPLRRFEASLQSQVPAFLTNIVRRTPTPWPPENPVDPHRDSCIADLNRLQYSVVNRICTTADGGLYNLIGPPGTGKTSTIVHLLAERVCCFPTQKILLTAPSNKAVQVVLEKFLKTFGVEFMVASLRVPADSSLEVRLTSAASFVDHILHPFAAVRRGSLDKMVEAYAAACVHAVELVRGLTTRDGRQVSKGTRTAVVGLQNDLTALKEVTAPQFHSPDDVAERARETERRITHAKGTLERYILQKAHIVFATLVTSGKRSLYKAVQHFDCVIVDEAAQALIPETFIPFKFDPALYLLIGDPQQLPGLVHSSELRTLGYAESLMGVLTEGQQRPCLERLTTQYRMHPSICKWVSDQFYDGELVADTQLVLRATSRQRLPVTWPLSGLPSAIIDCNFKEKKGKYGEISNVEEARAVVNAVKHLLKSGVSPDEIGVITFYSAQVELLKQLRAKLAREFPNMRDLAGKVTISTVDGFQGDERDFILISCVRSCPSVGFLSDPRRINVAMSRAKHARWVFCNCSALRQSNSVFADFHSWVSDVARNTAVAPARIVRVASCSST
jgi:DNA polymerase III delta prime subunit